MLHSNNSFYYCVMKYIKEIEFMNISLHCIYNIDITVALFVASVKVEIDS